MRLRLRPWTQPSGHTGTRCAQHDAKYDGDGEPAASNHDWANSFGPTFPRWTGGSDGPIASWSRPASDFWFLVTGFTWDGCRRGVPRLPLPLAGGRLNGLWVPPPVLQRILIKSGSQLNCP